MKDEIVDSLLNRLGKRYAGRYVGVIGTRVVAVGRDQYAVFKKAEKCASKNEEIGIFYVPSNTGHPLLLKITK